MNIHKTIGENGLGVLRLRTQSQDDESFRHAITPRKGQWLELKDISDTEFEIVVRYKEDGVSSDDEETPQGSLASKSKSDLLTVAAEEGVDVSPSNTKLEIMQAIQEARDAAK